MNNKQNKLSAILFMAVLLVFPVLTLISEKEVFSATENRNLASFPKISIESIKDKSFMDGLEKYLSDHFIGRTEWVEAKVKTEVLIGKEEINGVYITNDMLIQKLNTPDYDKVNKAMEAINKFAADNKANIYVMFAPTAGGIYSGELPKNAPVFNQKAFIEYMYNKLNSNVTTIDVYNSLYAVRDEYIYYRNDHHWTSYGAYCGYKTAIKKLGFSEISYDKYHIEHASNSFKGTLYSKTLYDKIIPDMVDLYNYENGAKVTSVEVNDGMEVKEYDSIYFREYLKEKDKYLVYLGPNQPLIKIKTDVKNERKLLVIKDSYANTFIPFLTQHYSEITVLDLRYIRTSYNDIVNMDDYNQVLIIYSAATMENDETLKVLNYK
ncbi:MAG: hypothetical protein GX286_07855 [Clostridiales bacterium]|nr:hypothetical protein [Clostridiales bacterium]